MPTPAQQLLEAVASGHPETVAALLDADPQLADCAERTARRWSALHIAADRGDVPVVELLLAAGASPNKRTWDGSSPLLLAALRGDLAVCRALLSAGADTRLTTNDGYSALDAAKISGCPELSELLAVEPPASVRNTFRGKREWS